MTNFSKSSSSASVLSSFDALYQVLFFLGAALVSALSVATVLGTGPEGYGGVVAHVPESLRDAVASAVAAKAATPALSLHAKIFFLQWMGLYLPYGLALFIFHLALPGLHKNVRRLGAFFLGTAFLIVCLGMLKSGNRAWGDAGLLAAVPLASPTAYQFLRALLFTLAMLGLSIPFVFNAGRDASRALRALIVAGLFVTWVAWDWRTTRDARSIHEANLSDSVRHRFVLVFPNTTRDVLLEALSLPEAQAMKERLVSLSPVFPVTSAVLPQLATLLSGRIPPEHGIRVDFPQPEALERLGERVRQERVTARHVHSTNAGSFDGTAHLLQSASDTGRWCSASVPLLASSGILEHSPLLAAMVPSNLLRTWFPEVLCNQRFFALEDLLTFEMAHIGNMLKHPLELDAWFSLAPNTKEGWLGIEEEWATHTPSEVAQRHHHLYRIARTLEVTAEQLSSWGIWHNSDVFVVGLGASYENSLQYGVYSLHSLRPAHSQTADAPPLAEKSTSNTVVSQVELSELLTTTKRQEAAEHSGPETPTLYNETLLPVSKHPLAPPMALLDEDGVPRVSTHWLRIALARSTRSTLCRYEVERPGGQKAWETVVASVENGPTPESSRVTLHPLLDLETTASLQRDAQGCAKEARAALVSTWANDTDLPERKWDTMALFRKENPATHKPAMSSATQEETP